MVCCGWFDCLVDCSWMLFVGLYFCGGVNSVVAVVYTWRLCVGFYFTFGCLVMVVLVMVV